MAKKLTEGTGSLAPRLLTVVQAAAYLSTTTWAIRKLAWSKDVPHIRLGTRLLFDVQDLNRFIERAKQGGKFGTVCSAGAH
jgi:excisionase family DNA binding protein